MAETVIEPSERPRWRRDLILVAALIFALLGGYAVINHQQDERVAQARAENRAAFLNGITANCKEDRRFRIQYRARGKAEKQLLDLFLDLAAQQVAAGQDPGHTSRDFIKQFAPLTGRIKVLPVPKCGALRRNIESALNPL